MLGQAGEVFVKTEKFAVNKRDKLSGGVYVTIRFECTKRKGILLLIVNTDRSCDGSRDMTKLPCVVFVARANVMVVKQLPD